MIEGIGTDIIEIKRIQASILRHGARFLDRLFTSQEQAYCFQYTLSASRFAGRFAAKEAIAKALGTGIGQDMKWTDIEILNNKEGKPEVILSPRLKACYPRAHFLLSISHCVDYAMATAILQTL